MMSSEDSPLIKVDKVFPTFKHYYMGKSKVFRVIFVLVVLVAVLVFIALATLLGLYVYGGTHPLSFHQCNDAGFSSYDEEEQCICFPGFSGDRCQVSPPPTYAYNVASGDPFIFSEYYGSMESRSAGEGRRLADLGLTCTLPSAYSSYTHASAARPFPALESEIRRIHAMTRNANITAEHRLLLGCGATQILGAVVAVASKYLALGGPAVISAQKPFYSGYPEVAAPYAQAHWNASAATADVELLTYPNNPDGDPRYPVKDAPLTVWDLAYHWPFLSGQSQGDIVTIDEDVMVFSGSKLLGLAGSRIGWAWIRDESLFELLEEHISRTTLGVSADSQQRAYHVLRAVLADVENNRLTLFPFVETRLGQRWNQLTAALGNQTRFAVGSAHGSFYLWLRCLWASDWPCGDTLATTANITGRSGVAFGSTEEYVRLSFATYDNVAEAMITRLAQLSKSVR